MNAQFIQDTPIANWKHPENGIKVILDPGDNITDKTTEHGAYEYTYDDLYRLTTVDNPSQYDDEEYTYDDVGNRLTSADTAGAWNYNQNNELAGYDTTSFVYDDNGNMVQKTVDGVVTSYVYNVEDRLTEVWDGEAGTGTLIATYYYDPFGRRLWKEVSGVKTNYHYADEGLIGEYDSAGSEIKTYGYKPNSTWTTDPLFMKEGSSYYFYHNDHLGTPQKMSAVNGAVVWSAKYSSFGKAEVDPSSTITNNLRFPGQYEDAETGLHYNYYRYYDPKAGRYLRTDPIKQKGGINIYAYVQNNPVYTIDPWGLVACDSCDDCPCGSWSGSGQSYGGFYGVAGWLTVHVTLNCECSSASKRLMFTSFMLGVGLGGSWERTWYHTWGVCNASELESGDNFTASGSGGHLGVGGSVSGSGGIDQGTFSYGVGGGLGGWGSLWSTTRFH